MEMTVEGTCEAAKLIPEDVPWAADPTEDTGTDTDTCVVPTDMETCVAMGAAIPEPVATTGLADCGVGCPAGTSVALLSGSAMDMRESRRRSFSVRRELRRMTGWDNMFISWPSGDVSRLNCAPSASAPPPRGTVFMEALPLRLTFMLSNLTSRSQKSVEIPRDWRVAAAAPSEFWAGEEVATGLLGAWVADLEPRAPPTPPEETEQRRESSSEAAADRSLQRCWVKWLGKTCRWREVGQKFAICFTEMQQGYFKI